MHGSGSIFGDKSFFAFDVQARLGAAQRERHAGCVMPEQPRAGDFARRAARGGATDADLRFDGIAKCWQPWPG